DHGDTVEDLRAGGFMRVCAMCGEAYSSSIEVCSLDGSRLSSWEEAANVTVVPDGDDPMAFGVDEYDRVTRTAVDPPARHLDGDVREPDDWGKHQGAASPPAQPTPPARPCRLIPELDDRALAA